MRNLAVDARREGVARIKLSGPLCHPLAVARDTRTPGSVAQSTEAVPSTERRAPSDSRTQPGACVCVVQGPRWLRMIVDIRGVPFALMVSGANRHESMMFEPLVDAWPAIVCLQGAIERLERCADALRATCVRHPSASACGPETVPQPRATTLARAARACVRGAK